MASGGPALGCWGHGGASGEAASLQARHPQRGSGKGEQQLPLPRARAPLGATVGEAQARALRAQGREDGERHATTLSGLGPPEVWSAADGDGGWTQGAAVTSLRVGEGAGGGPSSPAVRGPGPAAPPTFPPDRTRLPDNAVILGKSLDNIKFSFLTQEKTSTEFRSNTSQNMSLISLL